MYEMCEVMWEANAPNKMPIWFIPPTSLELLADDAGIWGEVAFVALALSCRKYNKNTKIDQSNSKANLN